MIKNQHGGRLDCGVSDDAPTFLLLGHGCEYINNIIDLPEGIVYVTKAICGEKSVTRLFYHEFIQDFFNDSLFFTAPCKHYSLSKKYGALDHITDYHSLLNFHYKKSPTVTGKSYPEMLFLPLTYFKRETTWHSYKSGLYSNKLNNASYSTHSVVNLTKKNDKYIINEEQIHQIYEGSLYPTADNIIKMLKQVKQYTFSNEAEDEYDTDHLQYVATNFRITLTSLIELIKTSFGFSEAIIINPLCRNPCGDSNVTHTDIMRRRADSLTTLNTHDNEDVSEFLGGKHRRRTIIRTKRTKKNKKTKNKHNKIKGNKKRTKTLSHKK